MYQGSSIIQQQCNPPPTCVYPQSKLRRLIWSAPTKRAGNLYSCRAAIYPPMPKEMPIQFIFLYRCICTLKMKADVFLSNNLENCTYVNGMQWMALS